MKRPATLLLVSVFVIWLCQMTFIVPFLAGILTFVGEFAGMTTPVAHLTGPLVCPAGTTARVDRVDSGNTSNINPGSFNAPAQYGNAFDCVDSAGNVVADKSGEATDLWGKIVTAATWILLTGLSFLIALPFGWLISRLVVKKTPSTPPANHASR